VEGPTEVKVVQQLLRRKKQDHLIFLMPMQGHLPDLMELDEITSFGESYGALAHYEKLGDVEPHWRKSQNWLLALASADEIDGTDFGQFLSFL
jgi:hypothetical protein